MGYYIAFSLLCALLALLYLNRGKGSGRLYPSIAATGMFLYLMYALVQSDGYAFQTAMTSCTAGIIAGIAAYWAALLVQWLWRRGRAGKAAAAVLCVCVAPVSVPTLLVGAAVHRLFRARFDAADAAAAGREAEKKAAQEAKARRREEKLAARHAAVDALLENVHSDDDLCLLFAQMYRRMGYAPVVERAGENGPLRMYLDRDGNAFSFVAIARQELLGADSVEWAAGFKMEGARAGLVTAGTFTGKAVHRAQKLGVALVDRPNLPRFEQAARHAEAERATGAEQEEK